MQFQFQKNLLQRLLDMSDDCIYFKDLDSRFIRVSRAMLRHFGLSDEEQMIGKRDSDFFLAEHADKAFKAEQEIIRTGNPLVKEIEKETWPDGHQTYALTNKAPLLDDKGKTIGTFGISKDITRLIQAEEALKKPTIGPGGHPRQISIPANMTHESAP